MSVCVCVCVCVCVHVIFERPRLTVPLFEPSGPLVSAVRCSACCSIVVGTTGSGSPPNSQVPQGAVEYKFRCFLNRITRQPIPGHQTMGKRIDCFPLRRHNNLWLSLCGTHTHAHAHAHTASSSCHSHCPTTCHKLDCPVQSPIAQRVIQSHTHTHMLHT